MADELETTTKGTEDNPSAPQPAGYLLGKYGLWAVLAGLLLAAWYGQVVVVVLLGLVLAAAGLARLWSRLSLVGVRCQRLLSERRVFPGEQIELKLRLVNRMWTGLLSCTPIH